MKPSGSYDRDDSFPGEAWADSCTSDEDEKNSEAYPSDEESVELAEHETGSENSEAGHDLGAR